LRGCQPNRQQLKVITLAKHSALTAHFQNNTAWGKHVKEINKNTLAEIKAISQPTTQYPPFAT